MTTKLVDYFTRFQKAVATPPPAPPPELMSIALAEVHMLRTVLADRGIEPPRLRSELEAAYKAKYGEPRVRDKAAEARAMFSAAEQVTIDAYLLSKGKRPS